MSEDIPPAEPAPTEPSVPQEPPQEKIMEIHKPHAAKTWKEFFIELGTVVIGILIAISLEQLVEYVHWQGEVTDARQALVAEMTANNFNLMAFRVAAEPCVQKQLNDADAILTALEAGQNPNKGLSVRTSPSGAVRDGEWQSERASEVLTHFPRAELALMSRYYSQLPTLTDWEAAENTAWQELSILQKPPARMTTSDLIRLRFDLAAARNFDYLMILNARREIGVVRQLGVADATDTVRVKNYCTMNAADYQRYRSAQDLH